MAVSGALYGIQGEEEKQSGVLAGQIPGVKTLQASLGLIREDVAAIKKSTENIEKTTARTEEVVKQVEKNTKANTAATKKVAEAVQESTKKIALKENRLVSCRCPDGWSCPPTQISFGNNFIFWHSFL